MFRDHDFFDCVISDKPRNWDAEFGELDATHHVDRESLMGFAAVNGGEGSDKTKVLGPETAGLEEDLHEITDFFAGGLAAVPDLVGIANASGDGFHGEGLGIHAVERERVALKKIPAGGDLAPVFDLQEAGDKGCRHPGKKDYDACEDLECYAGANFEHVPHEL
jgi:hypothetical protein